jgi:hypothetical protein
MAVHGVLARFVCSLECFFFLGARKEIKEELRATQSGASTEKPVPAAQQRFPLRTLTLEELNAVTTLTDFVAFVERSSKVIERVLDEDYGLLADYTLADRLHDSDNDPTPCSETSKKAHSLRQTLQLYSERHSRKRMISDIQFSPHFHELLLTSYTKNPSAPRSCKIELDANQNDTKNLNIESRNVLITNLGLTFAQRGHLYGSVW